ncbi:MAG: NADH:flavin oxidoreductase [Fibrobacteres bacterium]|nr:NADH:flavin oxidoreductase [Fibrobacterota bacterium]
MIFNTFTFCGLELKNRIARSATAERAADDNGRVSGDYLKFIERLAAGGSSLIITGHAFVEMDGANSDTMTGIHDDSVIDGHRAVAEAVHKHNSKIFMQISHCGRQSGFVKSGKAPGAPSAVQAPGCLPPREFTENEIEQLIKQFVDAAIRVKKSGYDGVQLHGAHGYLISQFVSPYSNRRTDSWGGSYENRFRFVKEIITGIKKEMPTFPLIIKWNSEDFIDGGLTQYESLRMVFDMEALGLDGIEISGGIFESSGKICRRHIKSANDEGYFAEFAKKLKDSGLKIPIILVGGFRTLEIMERVLKNGSADLISMSRPLVREPELPNRLKDSPEYRSTCVSCNSCLLKKDRLTRCYKL